VSGKQTIAVTLTAWLIATALGFAACSRQPPPLPGEPVVTAEPLRIADTIETRIEVFSDDALYRLELKCRAETGDPFVRATFVQCEGGGPSRAGWVYAVQDVPDWRRGGK
jgi:hypothetical protein